MKQTIKEKLKKNPEFQKFYKKSGLSRVRNLLLQGNGQHHYLFGEKEITKLKMDKKENLDSFVVDLINRQRFQFYQNAFVYLHAATVKGDYYEFGCHEAYTFRMSLTEARRWKKTDMNFFAFDSFEGMPELNKSDVSYKYFSNDLAGQMCTTEENFWERIKAHNIYVDRVQTTKGFYDKSLTPQLREKFVKSSSRIAFVNIDCDIYESAQPVFTFIEPLLVPGAIVYLDDYYVGYSGHAIKDGVPRALREHETHSRFNFVPYLDVGFHGKSFIAVEK